MRFDLMERCDWKLLTPEATSALWRVVEECDHAYYRARALRCATRIVRPADEERIARFAGEPGDVGLEALKVQLQRSDCPLALFLQTLRSDEEARRRAAITLAAIGFLSDQACPIPSTDESRVSILRELLHRIDKALGEEEAREALRALQAMLAGYPRPRLAEGDRRDAAAALARAAERHPSEAVRHLAKFCQRQID